MENEHKVSHLGIIMDGNRRWAKNQGLNTLEGHKRGYEKFQEVSQWCLDRDIKVLTVYAFSTENWNRAEQEVGYLMKLLEDALMRELDTFHEKQIKVNIIGRKNKLSKSILEKIDKVEEATKDYTKGVLNVALNYGGRAEMIHAIKGIVSEGHTPEEIDKDLIEKHLYTAGLPDPDLIIRTSGEQRTSNFLIWQAAYSEWYFTNVLWPDFSEKDLDEALDDYAARQRRYGK